MPNVSEDLLNAVINGDLRTVIGLAGDLPIDGKNTLQDQWRSPILCLAMECVQEGAVDTIRIAEELIRTGYPVNLANRFGDTPLHIAARKGQTFLIGLLIEKGAKIDIENKTRETPVHFAVYFGIDIAEIYKSHQGKLQQVSQMQGQIASYQKNTGSLASASSPAVSVERKHIPQTQSSGNFGVSNPRVFQNPKAAPAKPSVQAKQSPPFVPPRAKAKPQAKAQTSSTEGFKTVVSSVQVKSASGTPDEKDLYYYQDKLLKLKYAEILNKLFEVFFRDAVNQIKQRLGVEYLLEQRQTGSSIGVRVAQYQPTVFISYAQEDLACDFASLFYKHLTENLRCHAYFDQANMVSGIGFNKFENAIHNATFVVVIATPLYFEKYKVFKQHGRDKARSGVSDEMEMIENRLKNPQLQDGVIPIVLPGRIPAVSVDSQSGNVSVWVESNSDLGGGYQFLPEPLAAKFGFNCCDGKARKNTSYYKESFHFLKTLYYIPEPRYNELKRYKKLFLKAQAIIFGLSEQQIAPFKQKIDSQKAQFDDEVVRFVSEVLTLPQSKEVKDPNVFCKYEQSETEKKNEALLQALEEGKSSLIAVSRVKKQIDPQWKDVLGDTFLHRSAALGDVDSSEQLLKAGAEKEAENEDGNTPLSEAAAHLQLPTVSSLLAHGANAYRTNRETKSPLDRVLSESASKIKDPKRRKAYDCTALSLINAQAYQQSKPPEVVLAEAIAATHDLARKEQLRQLEKNLSQTHSLALTAQHELFGQLNFGLYQGSYNADSALWCLVGDDPRYGTPREGFKRDILVNQIKQAMTRGGKIGDTIKQHILEDITVRYHAYQMKLWNPEPFFPQKIREVFASSNYDEKLTPDFQASIHEYLDYLANRKQPEPVHIMISGFLDAVAELVGKHVYYWKEESGSLEFLYESKNHESPDKLHVLHQGIYFNLLKQQAQAGVMLSTLSADDLIAEKLFFAKDSSTKWILFQSYQRCKEANPQLDSKKILIKINQLLKFENFVLSSGEKKKINQNLLNREVPIGDSRHALMKSPKTYCDRVREKALSVVNKITTEEFKEIMRAASHYERDEVIAMLDKNPHLIYAQGDFDQAFEKTKEGQDKVYKNVTLFQYLWIIGDIKLCEVVMKYFSSEPKLRDAAIQALALDERKDIELFSYDDTIAQYENDKSNYNNWKKGVGEAQHTWPGYLVAQITELRTDNRTSWTEKNISMECVGVSDKIIFGSWHVRIKINGGMWMRGAFDLAQIDFSHDDRYERYRRRVWEIYSTEQLIHTSNAPQQTSLLNMYVELVRTEGKHFADSVMSGLVDLLNCKLRDSQIKAYRNRLSFDFRNQLSQKSEGITSGFDRQQPTC